MPQDFGGVMHEWGKGELHSGSKSGPVVKDQKQALAIAFSEDRKNGGSLKRTYPKGKKQSGQKSALHDRLKEARNG